MKNWSLSDYLHYNDVYRNLKTSIQIEHNALLSLAQLIYNNDECKNEFEANDGEYKGTGTVQFWISTLNKTLIEVGHVSFKGALS